MWLVGVDHVGSLSYVAGEISGVDQRIREVGEDGTSMARVESIVVSLCSCECINSKLRGATIGERADRRLGFLRFADTWHSLMLFTLYSVHSLFLVPR